MDQNATTPAATKIPILMIGLPHDHPSLKDKVIPFDLEKGLQKVQAQFDSSPYALHQYLIGPEVCMSDFTATLESKPWKGILIGFGIRGFAEHSNFFEDLVNLSHRCCPEAKFCFNSKLPNSLECVQRNVPIDATSVEDSLQKDSKPKMTAVQEEVPPEEAHSQASKSKRKSMWSWGSDHSGWKAWKTKSAHSQAVA